MGILLKIVGVIWALIGLGNLIGMPWKESSEGILMFGIMLNMLLFVMPGLVVYGIGSGIEKKKIASEEAASQESNDVQSELRIENRLSKLDDLKEKALINEAEYESQRAKILKEI
jgi:hypothetical protein